MSRALHANPSQIHSDQKRCHLPSIFQWHLHNSNIVVLFDPNSYEWAMTKEVGLHFLFSDGSLQFWCYSRTLWILWRSWFALSFWVFGILVWESHKCICFRTKELIIYEISFFFFSFFIFELEIIICRILCRSFYCYFVQYKPYSDKNKNQWWFQSTFYFFKKDTEAQLKII